MWALATTLISESNYPFFGGEGFFFRCLVWGEIQYRWKTSNKQHTQVGTDRWKHSTLVALDAMPSTVAKQWKIAELLALKQHLHSRPGTPCRCFPSWFVYSVFVSWKEKKQPVFCGWPDEASMLSPVSFILHSPLHILCSLLTSWPACHCDGLCYLEVVISWRWSSFLLLLYWK